MARDLELEGWVVARTPILPWRTVLDLGEACASWTASVEDREQAILADVAMVRSWIATRIDDPVIREALFVASPDLLAAEPFWRQDPDGKKGRRFETSVYRYLQRMATRCTPFGIFAGVAVGDVGEGPTQIRVGTPREHQKWTRIDMDYLCLLCDHLVEDPDVRPRIRWRVNDSLHRVGDKYVYVGFEINPETRERSYKLRDAGATEALDRVVAVGRSPARIEEIAGLFDPDVDNDPVEALAFVDQLATAQILLPELRPIVSGDHPVKELVAQLRESGCEKQAAALEQAQGLVDAVDKSGPGVPNQVYQDVAEHLREAFPGVKAAIDRLFQVDLKLKADVRLDTSETQKAINEALGVLVALEGGTKPPNPLASFIEAFQERYEDQEVPLLAALDEEHGIGARGRASGTIESEILAGLNLSGEPSPDSIPDSPARRLKLRWLLESAANGYSPIRLSAEVIRKELDPKGEHAGRNLEFISGSMINCTEDGIHFQNSLSGVELLGRFAGMDHSLLDGIKRLESKGEQRTRGMVLAEIVHHPGGRVGNVLLRPRIRSKELVYLGRSDAHVDDCINAADLLVSVRGGQVTLRHKTSGAFILPMLTNAHNVSRSSLGVYPFLNSIRFQNPDRQGYSWDWGMDFEEVDRLPRVMAGDVTLSPASWTLRVEKAGEISKSGWVELLNWAKGLQAATGLPETAVLADHDNLLLVDFRNPLSVAAFLAAIGSRTRVRLMEWAQPLGEHANEIVVPHCMSDPSALQTEVEDDGVRDRETFPERRVFEPGSEWLYIKLYAAPSVQDRIVCERVEPLARSVQEAGEVDKWFFIRYQDKVGSHLRLRFHLPKPGSAGHVLGCAKEYFADFLESGAINSMVLDTYRRELDRYAPEPGLMEVAESIFWLDSELVTRLTMSCPREERWKIAVRSLGWYMDQFQLPLADQLDFVRRSGGDYLREFRLDSPAKQKPLGDFFRKYKPVGVVPGDLPNSEEIEEALRVAESRIAPAVAAILPCIPPVVKALLHSFVHMHMNRLFYSDQRAHEMAVYAYLTRAMESQVARNVRGATQAGA